jgi:hypothetical protein
MDLRPRVALHDNSAATILGGRQRAMSASPCRAITVMSSIRIHIEAGSHHIEILIDIAENSQSGV